MDSVKSENEDERDSPRREIAALKAELEQTRRMREELAFTADLLRLLSAKSGLHELMRAVLGLLRELTGCEALGVRLREGGDFPYFVTRGFPPEFVKAERFLCVPDPEGQMLRDDAGNLEMECMCGNILCQRFDSSKPFFTEKGSFWSNCTTDLLAATTDADRQTRTRNRCNGEGYESVALIALRAGGETFGLLQFNDRRTGMFTRLRIEFLERMSDSIAIALAQRRAEKALRESGEKYRALFEHSLHMIFLTHPDGSIFDANPEACRALGMTVEEIRAAGRGEIVQDDRKLKDALEQRERMGKASAELIYIRKDGGAFTAEVESVIINRDWKDWTTFVAARDISKRKCAEAALRESEMKFRLLAEFTPDWEYWHDSDGNFMYVSPSAEHITGYRPEEFIADKGLLDRIIFQEDRDSVRDRISRALAEDAPLAMDFRIRRRDGETVWISHRCVVIRGENGEPLGRRATNRDITERRRMEDRINAALEEKVVLLREVHHRVKNNLAAVIGLMDMQSHAIRNETFTSAMEGLSGRIRSMALVHEWLYRSENLARIDFHDYLVALISQIRTARGVKSAIRCDVRVEGVEMDIESAIPCGMIVNELVTNAFKYAFPGDAALHGRQNPRIEVSIRREGDTYTLTVADNGAGIPEDLDPTGSNTLGLRLVRMLGEHQLGGAIEIDCTEGTRVTLTFTTRRRN